MTMGTYIFCQLFTSNTIKPFYCVSAFLSHLLTLSVPVSDLPSQSISPIPRNRAVMRSLHHSFSRKIYNSVYRKTASYGRIETTVGGFVMPIFLTLFGVLLYLHYIHIRLKCKYKEKFPWYRRTITLPESWMSGRVIAHFGAVIFLSVQADDGHELYELSAISAHPARARASAYNRPNPVRNLPQLRIFRLSVFPPRI